MMNDTTFTCHKISEGFAEGEVLISTDDIMFYLIDPQTGVVIEKDILWKAKAFPGKY
jgi:predicted aconitase with swiveling domain